MFELNRGTRIVLAAVSLFAASNAAFAAKQKVCVYDILGAGGDVFNMSKDWALDSAKNGADIELKAYTDERVAAEDFKTGQCDGVIATSFRTRQFNSIAGSMDALGSSSIVKDGKVTNADAYKVVQTTIQYYSSEKGAGDMVRDKFEVAGIIPFGAAFLFVNDRGINSVEKLSGKKIAVFDYDKAQSTMVQKIGAQPVSADITNFATKFNNGSVDIIAAPAAAYKPLELFKGLGAKGGIVRFPLTVLTYQIVINKDKFPADFGKKSRNFWLSQFDRALKLVESAEKGIPADKWVDIPTADAVKYTIMLRESRTAMAQTKMYDENTLKLMKKVRCKLNQADSECADPAGL
ncbi:MAG: DUF6091 family protein [Burkholderiales bacterium]|jgi:ABC-type amino acid transport substrate-binding protein|nr:DUF6091 family protein [Burkholderiales bacterium]